MVSAPHPPQTATSPGSQIQPRHERFSAFRKICFAKLFFMLLMTLRPAKKVSGCPHSIIPMSDIFSRFSLHAAKFSGQVWLCLAAIWLVVLGCAITSIYAQPFSSRQRKFWLSAVVCIPLLGVLAYLPFSFRREQLAQLFFIRLQRDRNSKHATMSGRSTGGRRV